jgi:hypothetical protein
VNDWHVQVCCGAAPPPLSVDKKHGKARHICQEKECGWLIGIPRCIAELSGSWVVQERGKVLLINFFVEYLWMIDYNIMPIAQVSVWCGAVQWQLSYTRKWQSAAYDVYSREYSMWMIGIPRYVAELSHGCCEVVQERGRVLHMMFIVENTSCEWLAFPGMLRSCPTAVELYKNVAELCIWRF